MNARLDEKGKPMEAVALVSGGLDSMLAAAVIARQGVKVHGVNFSIGFSATPFTRESMPLGEGLEMEVRLVDVAREFIHEVLIDPEHGRGQQMNPCIDCHLFMVIKARGIMEEIGARFVITGEVLGQRPMSQHLQALKIVEEKSGLKGLLLRPLSARHLDPTIPEERGWVDRERLLGVRGRSRKEQIALAASFGISEYSQPAGGCLLTSPGYSHRLEELMENSPDTDLLSPEDMKLLRFGRHFRLPSGIKVIVGRNEDENAALTKLTGEMWHMEVIDRGSPVTLVEPGASEEDLRTAAALTARYSQGRAEPSVGVRAIHGGDDREIEVVPAGPAAGDDWLIY